MCRAVHSTAPAQPVALPEALAFLSPFLQQLTGVFSLVLMNVVCMPRAV